MGISITQAADYTDLTTLETIKETLQITDSSRDGTIARLIQSASRAIESYTQHAYARQTYEESLTGEDHPILILQETPIRAVSSVVAEGSPITDYTIHDSEAGMLYREAGWATGAWIGWSVEPDRIPGTAEMIYVVTYEAGYYCPGHPDRDLPTNIEQACIETVKAWFEHIERASGTQTMEIGDFKISYGIERFSETATAEFGLPAMARSLLSRRGY